MVRYDYMYCSRALTSNRLRPSEKKKPGRAGADEEARRRAEHHEGASRELLQERSDRLGGTRVTGEAQTVHGSFSAVSKPYIYFLNCITDFV